MSFHFIPDVVHDELGRKHREPMPCLAQIPAPWPAISRALEATLLRVYRQRRDPTVDDPGPRASLCQRATRPRLRRPQERTRRTRRALDGPHAAYAPGAGGRLAVEGGAGRTRV